MGELNLTHGCWSGPFSDFNDWRAVLALDAGYQINPIGTPVIEWDRYSDENFLGEWQEMPSDPLLILIVHFDDGGVIHPEHAVALADRLESLLPQVQDWQDETVRFISGLRVAAAAKEDVVFSVPTIPQS